MRGAASHDQAGGYVGGVIAVAAVLSPLGFGVYRAVTDWPLGLMTLAAVVLFYVAAGALITMHGTVMAR